MLIHHVLLVRRWSVVLYPKLHNELGKVDVLVHICSDFLISLLILQQVDDLQQCLVVSKSVHETSRNFQLVGNKLV